ncbi:MAG: DUF2520 domain-containing protein [Candidatus Acidiferrales bacterium]|jgi:predicted short-subunit dehydrogenase-like oxidoreductase (DUF2520 family)
MKRSLSIVGAGRVGRTLGKRLQRLGWRIGAVVTRSAATSRVAVREIGAGKPYSRLVPEILESDVILLTTPDGALSGVAAALAKFDETKLRGKIVLHTSGALDRTVLAPLARRGASIGSIHPMQTFTGRGAPKLEKVIFAVEGDRSATMVARKIARSLGGVPVTINSKNKPAYHAAGALVAGHGLGLIEAATQVLLKLGFRRRDAMRALLPLMRQMLDNFEQLGPRESWTGPVSRGDFATVAKHTKALRSHPSEFNDAHAALALLASRILSKNPGAASKQLKRALRKSTGGKS